MEFKSLQEEPVEGFTVKLINEDLFEWQVAIFGPPSTLYEGAYFKVSCTHFVTLRRVLVCIGRFMTIRRI